MTSPAGEAVPGVLVARRQSVSGGWRFLCVFVVDEGREAVEEDLVVVTQWLDQGLVRPAE